VHFFAQLFVSALMSPRKRVRTFWIPVAQSPVEICTKKRMMAAISSFGLLQFSV
jgi:hypothetical protein